MTITAVVYNGKAIIPAPMINYSKVYQTSDDGTIVGTSFQIVLEGKFLPSKGSPTSSGTLWLQDTSLTDDTIAQDAYLGAMLRKQEALRGLFANEGKTLRLKPWDSGLPFTCNPRLKSPIEFPRGSPTSWANVADYRITLEADVIYFGDGTFEDGATPSGYKIETAESNWVIEPENYDLGTYRVSHQVSAKGKRFYSSSGTLDKPAWENARDYVLNVQTLALNSYFVTATGVLNNNNLGSYNYARTQSINEMGGTFLSNCTWLSFAAVGAPATDEFEVNTKTDMAGNVTTNLQGKITGLATTDNTTGAITTTKYANAVTKFDSVSPSFLARASGYAGTTLHGTPLSYTIGRNPINGIISYNYEFDNRPSNSISGALSEVVQVTFSYPKDVFCELTVLSRANGPVLQSIQTITSSKKSVSIEAVLPARTQTTPTPTKPETTSLISGYAPSFLGGSGWVFKDNDNENWNETTGRYSRMVSWTYNN